MATDSRSGCPELAQSRIEMPLASSMDKLTKMQTFLWFREGLEDALEFYRSTFDVVVNGVNRTSDGRLFTADFRIYEHDFIGMCWDGGPAFNSAISLMIQCEDQEEVDRLWEAITAEGEEIGCGWCRDQWGVVWQVVPKDMRRYLEDPDPAKREFADRALRGMKKIVLRDLYE
jgi:predicted 3-demethylubiquinone-9 3-methyltransferase (glyoxalase superfamily)